MRGLPAGLLKQGSLQGAWGGLLPQKGPGVLAAQAESDAAAAG